MSSTEDQPQPKRPAARRARRPSRSGGSSTFGGSRETRSGNASSSRWERRDSSSGDRPKQRRDSRSGGAPRRRRDSNTDFSSRESRPTRSRSSQGQFPRGAGPAGAPTGPRRRPKIELPRSPAELLRQGRLLVGRLPKLEDRLCLVAFLDFSSIDSQRRLEYLKAWHRRYEELGVTIIGVHNSLLERMRQEKDLKRLLEDWGVTFPVVQDAADQVISRSMNNAGSLCSVLFPQRGRVEFYPAETPQRRLELDIQRGLSIPGLNELRLLDSLYPEDAPGQVRQEADGDLILGFRYSSLANPQGSMPYEVIDYHVDEAPSPQSLRGRPLISGLWESNPEFLGPLPEKGTTSSLELVCDAREIYLLAEARHKTEVVVQRLSSPLDEEARSEEWVSRGPDYATVQVGSLGHYKLISGTQLRRQHLRLTFSEPGIRLFALSFTDAPGESAFEG